MKTKRFILIVAIFCLFIPTALKAQEEKARRAVAAVQAGDREPSTYYNAACYLALAGKTDEAFDYLKQAIERGYANVEQIKTDSDLISLHSDGRWQALIGIAATKRAEQQKLFWNQKTFWDNPVLNTAYKVNLSEDEKVAGISKFWSEVKYNFANFDLVPNLNWDAVYLEYLAKAKTTKSTFEYYRLLQEMCARLHDGHTNVFFPKEINSEANSKPLLRTRLIENRVIIVGVYDETLKVQGITPGLEILEIDATPIKQYAEQKIAPYQSASTAQDLEARTYEYSLLNASSQNSINLTLRSADGKIFNKTLTRLTPEERVNRTKKLALNQPFEYKVLPGNVAYIALNAFDDYTAADQFAANFDEIAKSGALIIDLRNNGGGNSGVGYRVLSYLTDKPFATSGWYTRQYRPTFRPWERAQETYGEAAGLAAPNGKKLYAKPVIVLTGAKTYSAAEDFMVAYVTMKRGLTIGEPTGGSTGQPMFIGLPGGGQARICTKRDRFPDGSDFVGKGIQPDRLVRPTIADFRAGRDTVLEAARGALKAR